MAAWFGTAVCAGFFLTPIRAKERQGHDRGAAGLGKIHRVGSWRRAARHGASTFVQEKQSLGPIPSFWVLPSPYVIIQKR